MLYYKKIEQENQKAIKTKDSTYYHERNSDNDYYKDYTMDDDENEKSNTKNMSSINNFDSSLNQSIMEISEDSKQNTTSASKTKQEEKTSNKRKKDYNSFRTTDVRKTAIPDLISSKPSFV